MGMSRSTRAPAVAGAFYPGSAVELHEVVSSYLAAVDAIGDHGTVRCILVPHAGYRFSGPTAAHAYARLSGQRPRRVILLGCSHRYKFPGASIVTEGAFATPLGPLPIDSDYAKELAGAFGNTAAEAHADEHSLEVQLPFIREVLGEVPIVPVLFGDEFGAWHRNLARYLAKTLDEDDVVVISTDLSHYLTESQANALDQQSIEILLRKDVDAFLDAASDQRLSMCGVTAVATGIEFCSEVRADEWHVLDYRTSAVASGDASRVVGYAAVSMEHASCS